MSIPLISLLLGAVFATGLTVVSLPLLVLCGAGFILVLGGLQGVSFSTGLKTCLLAGLMLQIGYIGGLLVRYLSNAPKYGRAVTPSASSSPKKPAAKAA